MTLAERFERSKKISGEGTLQLHTLAKRWRLDHATLECIVLDV